MLRERLFVLIGILFQANKCFSDYKRPRASILFTRHSNCQHPHYYAVYQKVLHSRLPTSISAFISYDPRILLLMLSVNFQLLLSES